MCQKSISCKPHATPLTALSQWQPSPQWGQVMRPGRQRQEGKMAQASGSRDCVQRARVCVCVCVRSLSRVWLFATSWTVALQAPLSMEFSRQEPWSGKSLPSARDLPNPGTEPRSPALREVSLLSEPPEKPAFFNTRLHPPRPPAQGQSQGLNFRPLKKNVRESAYGKFKGF